MQRLEGDYWLGEALFVPEISRLAQSPLRLRRVLAGNARSVLERTALHELMRRHAPIDPQVHEYMVNLPAHRELPLWHKGLELRFPAVWWRQGDSCVAFVPALGLEVIADTEAELHRRVPPQILQHFDVTRRHDTMMGLLLTQRCTELSCQKLELEPDIPTPKERAVQYAQSRQRESVLREVAVELAAAPIEPAFERETEVRLLAEALGQPAPESVLLVGPSGVGKTAIFRELVRRRNELQFAATPFWATSGSRLVAGMSGFGMWQQRCDDLRREASGTRAIVHLGNLVELMEVGKGSMIRQGVAGFLRPFIARGELQCVVECTPEQLPRIEAADPQLLGAFKRIEIAEPAPQAAQAILLSMAHELADGGPDPIQIEALQTLDRLHRRYATYSAYPGRPLRFLRNLVADRKSVATEADVYQAFTRETGMPRELIDPGIPLDPEATRGFFAGRVMGQDSALALVTDLLATVKAGLARPGRPLASYLFVGPTGVGKTETAKALAEYLFGDARRMTRFDMSEYATGGAVRRLVGGAFGDEGLLTAALREQPFCVLLLDEFEKAHPSFFDLLLQVLGEARLTDAAGRLADFRNAVVIMTSNLGAESFMQGGMGFAPQPVDAREHFTRALERFVRPELVNRIDRVVPFSPLPPEVVERIVRRELDLIRRRPGLSATGATLTVEDDAVGHLAHRAYQPELGARPLKREIASALLAPLAEALNTQSTQYALETQGVLLEGAVKLLATPARQQGEARARTGYDSRLAQLASRVAALRRKLQKANASPALLSVRNAAFRLERTLELHARSKRKLPPVEGASRLPALKLCEASFSESLLATAALEDELLLAAFGHTRADEAALGAAADERQAAWDEALRRLMRLSVRHPDAATLWIYSHNNDLMFDLAGAYHSWSRAQGMQGRVFWASAVLDADDARDLRTRQASDELARACLLYDGSRGTKAALYPPRDAESFLAEPRGERGAIVLAVEAPDALLQLTGETGLHRFRHDPESEPINVQVVVHDTGPLQAALPLPAGVADEGEVRRRYELATRQAHDTALDTVTPWTGRALEQVLARCIGPAFARRLERQVGL